MLKQGATGVFPCGTTSEGLLLSPDERREVAEEVIRSVDKKTPVVVHTGAMDLATTIELTRHARDCGALAASIVTPWYYLYDDEALFQYYRTIARAVDKFPILLYNIPACGRNACCIPNWYCAWRRPREHRGYQGQLGRHDGHHAYDRQRA